MFTGGGTEGDNLAIRGVAEALEPAGRKHLIASAIEHEAVLNTLKALARRGWKTTLLPVDESGIVSPDALRSAMTDDTALVSVMHANNEIGTVQPIAELAAIARERGALFHTDAVQSAGKIPIDVRALGVDLLSISAHKFYGPKGVGALWIRRGVRLQPPLTGGKQERSRRAGTENVAGIAGMGVAAREAIAKMDSEGVAAGRAARSPRGRHSSWRDRDGVERRPRTARAQHDEHQLRSNRSRVAADRARSRRRCRIDWIVQELRRPACRKKVGNQQIHSGRERMIELEHAARVLHRMNVRELLQVTADDEEMERPLVNVDEARDERVAFRIPHGEADARCAAVGPRQELGLDTILTGTQGGNRHERHPAQRTLPHRR